MELENPYDNIFRPAFNFENVSRNAGLAKLGIKAPKMTKTGTTIVGVTYKDGVIIGADSRATAGDIIADKYCVKLHKITDSMYACGAGTAADLDQVCEMISANLKLHELNTGRKARVIAALRTAKQHLFKYMGYVGAYLILGGVDFYGPHLYSVHAHGSTSVDPYLADGSGSLAALGVLERDFKMNMEEDKALDLLSRALMAGMHSDLNSGNTYCYGIIKKEGTKIQHGIVPDFCKTEQKDLKYNFAPNTSTVLKTKKIKFDVVEKMEM